MTIEELIDQLQQEKIFTNLNKKYVLFKTMQTDSETTTLIYGIKSRGDKYELSIFLNDKNHTTRYNFEKVDQFRKYAHELNKYEILQIKEKDVAPIVGELSEKEIISKIIGVPMNLVQYDPSNTIVFNHMILTKGFNVVYEYGNDNIKGIIDNFTGKYIDYQEYLEQFVNNQQIQNKEKVDFFER